ncbi:MAG: hypothetical protein ACI33M_00075 [Lysinibacillus sp.]
MSIDMSSLLSVYNSSLLNKTASNPTSIPANTNFSDYLMDVLDNRKSTTSKDDNALYKTLTYSTNMNSLQAMLGSGSSSTALTQYLSNYTGDSGTNPIFNNTNQAKNSEYFSDTLTSSFETKMLNVLTGAKTKLENNMTQYADKMGDDKSQAVQQTLTRMQNNISVLENYLSQRSTENGLMNALNSNSNLTQYLINKNNGTL